MMHTPTIKTSIVAEPLYVLDSTYSYSLTHSHTPVSCLWSMVEVSCLQEQQKSTKGFVETSNFPVFPHSNSHSPQSLYTRWSQGKGTGGQVMGKPDHALHYHICFLQERSHSSWGWSQEAAAQVPRGLRGTWGWCGDHRLWWLSHPQGGRLQSSAACSTAKRRWAGSSCG